MGFPGGAEVKNLPVNAEEARNASSIPRMRRSPGVGNGNPLQYCCLENSWTEESGEHYWTHTYTHDYFDTSFPPRRKLEFSWGNIIPGELGCILSTSLNRKGIKLSVFSKVKWQVIWIIMNRTKKFCFRNRA